MVDTMDTGTMPIEANALMQECVRFDSEPWTSFYMAGEIIRESRKASGKQSTYASEANMAHSDEVLKDDSKVDIGLGDVSGSSDVMELKMRIDSEMQVTIEPEFKTFGCDSAMASSSLATEQAKSKSSRNRWPSRTRISSASSAFLRATLHSARHPRIGGRLYLVGSPIF